MRRYLVFLVLLSFGLAACGGGGDGGPVPVASVSVSPPAANLFVGQTVQLSASPKDENATVLTGRSVTWSSESNAIATVSSAGVVTAVSPGQVRIIATSEGKTGSVVITVSRVPVASVTVSPQGPAILVGQTVQLQATVKDASNNTLTDTVSWTSSDQSKATVSPSGLVTGIAQGTATITAESEGVSGSTQVVVNTPANAPQITGITPALLVAGATGVTLTGTNFSATPVSNLVTIDGVSATVTAASPTQLTISLPATGFACEATHAATVSVTVAGVAGTTQHPLQVARQIALAVGQSDLILDPALVRCNELSTTGGRYTISVFNTSTVVNAATSFELRGSAATALAGSAQAVVPAVVGGQAVQAVAASGPLLGRDPYGSDKGNLRKAAGTHGNLLEQNRRILERSGSPIPELQRARASNQAVSLRTTGAAQMPISGNVGDTSSVKIAKIKAFPTSFCSNDTTIRARTVYSGTRSIIVEDVNNPLANTMDSYFQAVGTEFDNVMFPILQTNFGNPLAMDSQLDNNGKLVMVFSNVINIFGGIAGFVVTCDFYPTSTFSASNVGETFYALAPNNAQAGFPQGLPSGQLTKDNWRRIIRATIIHEAKHITSFAERIARNASSLEEIWLEEGTAFHAEELWSRTIYGTVWKGNTAYDVSLYCDVRPNFAQCADRPFVMFDHFSLVYDYLGDPEGKSPLSTPGTDFSFYGSTWSLVRWAIDQYASSDAAFLSALTQETSLTGVTNLVARSGGKTFAELLGYWSLSNALDDAPGFSPSQWQPSWNTREIFARMNQDFPPTFPRVFPLVPRQAAFGNFVIAVPSLRSGTSSFFELAGAQSTKQLVEVRSSGGGDPPSTLRVGIVRAQ